jgi:hypothetical protein
MSILSLGYFYLFSLIIIPSFQIFPENRYLDMILNISALTQTSTGMLDQIELSSKHNYFNMLINNLRLISPVLSKITFSYPYPNFSSIIQASNIIFTFVSNINIDINDYIHENEKYSFTLDDFLFQLTYPYIEFNVDSKMKMNIETFSEPTLFFSNAHSIGTLKSFSFFNEDEENQHKLLHFFNEIVQNKYYSLLNSTNLIEYDMILLFTYMEQYYNQTEITDNLYNMKNLTIKSHQYSKLSDVLHNATLILDWLEIEMNVGTKDNKYITQYCRVNKFKIDNCIVEFNNLVCDPVKIKNPEEMFQQYYEKTFKEYHHQYFNETSCFENDTNYNII